MFNKIRKHIFRLWGLKLAIITIAVIGIILISNYVTESRKITGNEWFSQQYSYMNNMADFCNEIDTVYALYLSGNMTTTDFLVQHDLLVKQYEIMEANYQVWLDNNPVKTGTFSYVSKKGQNAIIDLREDIEGLLLDTVPNGTPQNIKDMTYTYLQYNDSIEDDLIEYVVAFRWLVEADTAGSSMKRVLDTWNAYIESQSTTATE